MSSNTLSNVQKQSRIMILWDGREVQTTNLATAFFFFFGNGREICPLDFGTSFYIGIIFFYIPWLFDFRCIPGNHISNIDSSF
jgi:hypothetical protein